MKLRFLGLLAVASGCLINADPGFSAETVNYTYDELGRLIESTSSGSVNNGKTQSIEYDAAGNRESFSYSDPSSGPVNLAIGNASANEGANLNFTVTRSGNIASVVSVHYATASGSATSGTDFTAKSGTLSFAANQTSKTIAVSTVNDSISEATENMTVSLSAPSSGGNITAAIGSGSIIDNDSGWASLMTVGEVTWMIDLGMYGSIPVTRKGYMGSVMGTMSNTSFNGATIVALDTIEGGSLEFAMTSSSSPGNSGWSSITVPGIGTFNRSAGSYSTPTASQATWTWPVSSGEISDGTVTIQ